ncbi:gamma-mobile-trio integrase GmtZ [Paraburkholderia lacunae]|uniref:Integrase n=1 Tax=Paraburkholderia lacunae TaxID=2211104 RepID=A0A370N7C5_9BURK|nr:integrase family protein [Paraburkholderia lacunae]RDK01509.1 integrase [Paraburkholderia lacunae]
MVKISATKPKGRRKAARTERSKSRDADPTLSWVEEQYPELDAWRVLALEWIRGETHNLGHKLSALSLFLERYLFIQRLPLDPTVFLAQTTHVPEFHRTACSNSQYGISANNHVHAFLQFVLLRHFSQIDEAGKPVVMPVFHNPVPRMSKSGFPKRDESVHSPLPYGYIDQLRQILAAGPHFRDWRWAQNALGARLGCYGANAPDWFDVTEDQIDHDDPDCVWRIRKLSRNYRGGQVLQMWSPVRWVAMLVKLILPLRTSQVRVLDSGEADTWRYACGRWQVNLGGLARGSESRPLQQGVFRALIDGEASSVVLYINTNKTADIARSRPENGYVMPWTLGGEVHQNVFYWLEKLRDWQEKYNPVARLTSWMELDRRHINAKSDVQLARYPDMCFLFRMRESPAHMRHLPLNDAAMDLCWFRLLGDLELRLADRAETHRNGAPIRLLPSTEEQGGRRTLFPLHSLRVSLITALALEGQVPFPVLQKLVGHSRLVMTLYYTKPGATYIHDMLLDAKERLEANKEASIQNFLLDTSHDELLQKAICNSSSSVGNIIPEHPAARNPVGWMPMHHGLCTVGGNTHDTTENRAVGGCHNGGALILPGTPFSNPKHAPVPGGSRNCIRCRWFVTEPHYLPALAAHFNTVAYHFDEARNTCLASDKALLDLKKQKADSEEAGHVFTHLDTFRQAERVWEGTMKRFNDLAEDLAACWRLIERCKSALDVAREGDTQLVAVGAATDVHLAFEETESELLQLAGVCENVELYPDLDAGKAVFRRSQLLDAVLYRDDVPPMFMMLSEDEQLRAGNAFMRRLAQQMNPANPVLGQRQVINLMDAGESLSERFGVDLTALLPKGNSIPTFARKSRTLADSDARTT